MEELNSAIIAALVPVLTGIGLAIGGWILSKLPGPARELLEASVHSKDMAALVGTLQRRAMAEVANHLTPTPTAADLIAYAERVRPALLTKMSVEPEALATMAEAAIATATVATTAPAVVVAPPS
jgi:hypothetical protein